MFEKNTIDEFTKILASQSAVPGGGGASAIVAAIGISLGHMVGSLTVGKPKYADVEKDIIKLMDRAEKLRLNFLNDAENDAIAFEPLAKAYGIPKDDPHRDEVMEGCLRTAASAPLEIFRHCMEAVSALEEFAESGSKLVISDVATGIAHIRGAMYGAAVNVKVNTKLMKDKECAEKLNRYIDQNIESYTVRIDRVWNKLYNNF